jgi:hypothetical protein
MKSSNIADSVYRVNLKYVQLQNKTKEVFFQCLENNRDVAYFNRAINEIWGNIDHTFMQEEIDTYAEVIHNQNLETMGMTNIPNEKYEEILKMIPIAIVIDMENKFIKQKQKEYKSSLKTINKIESRAKDEITQEIANTAKEEYLKLKVERYTDQIVPYFSRTTGKKIRDVELSTYASMVHNTNLTRTGWNTTLSDADATGYKKFYIPYHSFSCPYCISHQNRVLTKKEVINLIGDIEEQEGDILHPNCKCVLTLYDKYIDYKKPKYSNGELEEQYHIRQRVNSLTLEEEKIITDIKIQERLGNYDEADKLKTKLSKVNSTVRELTQALPTTELKRQVVAINR